MDSRLPYAYAWVLLPIRHVRMAEGVIRHSRLRRENKLRSFNEFRQTAGLYDCRITGLFVTFPQISRWGAQVMRHFASSHIQPFAPSPACLVVPVREVSAVPSLPHTRRFAAACAFCWRPRRVAPVEAPAQVRASRGHTSACVLGRGSVASVGRPLLLGRLAGVTQVRRVPSSAHHCRRIASADSCATRVVCDGGVFAPRIQVASSALALARVVPVSPVNRSAPTHRSSGAAPKAAQPAQLKR